jgi:hypothetical protein
MIILNHNVAGDQPISEVITDIDLAFNIGIGIGFVCGFMIGIFIYACYRDYKEDKLKS